MKHRMCAAAALALVLSGSFLAPLHARVINFDDIANVPAFGNPVAVRATFTGLGIAASYNGGSWPGSGNFLWGVVNNSDFSFSTVGAYSGSQSAWNWGGSLLQEVIFQTPQTVAGAWFDAFTAGVQWTADTVQFVGYDAAGNRLGSSPILHLDKNSPQPAWQWLSFGETNVTRLDVVATQTSPAYSGSGWWAMDDLTVINSSTVVPEPAALYLFTLGGAVLLLRHPLIRNK